MQTLINPLNPHDASKHNFASLKNDLISWNLEVLERKFSWNCFKNNSIFFHLSPTSTCLSHFHPLQAENCDSNSWLVVDEDDNGKFRLERVNSINTKINQFLPVSYIILIFTHMKLCVATATNNFKWVKNTHISNLQVSKKYTHIWDQIFPNHWCLNTLFIPNNNDLID